MLICQREGCSCFHHRLLDCIQQGLNDEAEVLLQKVDNFYNAVDVTGKTLLHYAVEYNNAKMVEYLIKKGCNVNAQDCSFGTTPLMLALRSDYTDISKILFTNNADIFVTDCEGESALEISFYESLCSSRKQPILKMFFEKLNTDFATDRDKFAKLLMDADGMIKLIFAVCGDVEMTKFMLKNGSKIDDFREPDTDNSNDWTALHCAIRLRAFKTVKSLIQLGANVSALDVNKASPLSFYVTYRFECVDKQLEILKVLLSCRDNWHTRYISNNYRGVSHFLRLTDVECLLLRAEKEIVRTILQSDNGSYLDTGNLLHVLIANKIFSVNDIIELDIPIDANTRFSSKRSILQTAVAIGSMSKVEFLLRHGANVNYYAVYGNPGNPALAIATRHGRADIIELLLQNRADAQFVFNDKRFFFDDRHFVPFKMIIVAHLAMLEAIDKSTVSESTRNRINAHSKFKNYFTVCLQQLEKLKSTVVYGMVTLFKLLTENEEKLTAYARNEELIATYEITTKTMSDLESYYVNTLQKRVAKAVDRIESEGKVAPIIEELTGLCADRYHTIVCKIMNHLTFKDFENLGRLDNSTLRI